MHINKFIITAIILLIPAFLILLFLNWTFFKKHTYHFFWEKLLDPIYQSPPCLIISGIINDLERIYKIIFAYYLRKNIVYEKCRAGVHNSCECQLVKDSNTDLHQQQGLFFFSLRYWILLKCKQRYDGLTFGHWIRVLLSCIMQGLDYFAPHDLDIAAHTQILYYKFIDSNT